MWRNVSCENAFGIMSLQEMSVALERNITCKKNILQRHVVSTNVTYKNGF